MLPLFPNFKKIEIIDLDIIDSLTKNYPPYNDFEFLSLWTYNTTNNNSFSVLNNNLVIKIQDFITGNSFYSFIGRNNVIDTIKDLFKIIKSDGLVPQIRLVPEINFKDLSDISKYFLITEDIDSNDYILSVEEISELNGNKYHDKRNMVNRFKRENPIHTIESLNLDLEKTKKDIEDLFLLWEENKKRDRSETEIELIAVKKIFDVAKVLNLSATGIYINNTLAGFSIHHIVHNNYAILSFEKCDTTYRGIYEYLNQQTAINLKKLGAEYINYEQDLGISGLRKAKSLWRPIFFLKKYTVEELPSVF